MPHFSKCCGADEYICQVCWNIFCDKCRPSEWRPDVTGHKSAGNVCPSCLKKFINNEVENQDPDFLDANEN